MVIINSLMVMTLKSIPVIQDSMNKSDFLIIVKFIVYKFNHNLRKTLFP